MLRFNSLLRTSSHRRSASFIAKTLASSSTKPSCLSSFHTSISTSQASTPSNDEAPPKFFVLEYKYVSDVLEKRDPFRPQHLDLAREFKTNGDLLAGGAFAESPLGALFIFKAESEAAVKASFVEKDPYVSNGLVVEHTVRELLIPPGLY